MRKHIKNTILTISIFMMIFLVFTPKSYGSTGSGLRLKINTVIDNYDELPNNIRTQTYQYAASRITNMRRHSSNEALSKSQSHDRSFDIKHGSRVELFFENPTKDYNYDLLWFGSATNTKGNISLESVEFHENLSQYTYDDLGRAKAVNPFNWLEVINSPGKNRNKNIEDAEVTLHFRYNPNIDEMLMEEPDIEPTYTKKIDYIGNKETEAGTVTNNNNYYRLYLDFNPGKEWRETDKERDIVIVYDVSNSMERDLGKSTRWKVLKNTLGKAVDKISTNEKNYISMIAFGTNAEVITKNNNDPSDLRRIVNDLKLPRGAAGGTNFYEAMLETGKIINENPQDREKVIFFISDGEPTASQPAAETFGYERNSEVATSYAYDASKNFQRVDNFYSIFVGDQSGASTLQTFTNMIDVKNEKFTVEALDEAQLENAFNRFMASLDISFNDVVIEDKLSEYADYARDLKVHKTTEDGDREELKVGLNYELLGRGSNSVAVKLLDEIKPETNYEVSFDIRASDKAISEYDETGVYPHIGDPNTDYPGNITSSERPGFYSNDIAELSYNFGSNDTISKEYPKPVLQVHEFNPVEVEVELEKNLTGKDLEKDEFEFVLNEIIKDEDGNTEKSIQVSGRQNDENGNIDFGHLKFSKPGQYIFEAKEIIPENKNLGYTYDDRTLRVIVDVIRHEDRDVLEAGIRYPDGTKFRNKYKLEPISVDFNLQKEMEGKELDAGDFQFRLFDGNMKLIETVSNEADGQINFSSIELTKPSKYQFIVREIVPNPQDPNIIYDLDPANINVDVSDNNGKLEAEVNYLKRKFTNRYEEEKDKIDADLEFNVILTGMQLSKDMFEFELRDSNGQVYKAKNKSDGKIVFNGLTFNKTGQYNYTIKQIIPDSPIKYMNYDKDSKKVTVNVTGSSGNLDIEVEYEPDNTFYNKYKFSGRIW